MFGAVASTPDCVPSRSAVASPVRPMLRGNARSAPERGGLSNAELVRLIELVASRKDREAFAQLFRFYAPRLKSFVMRAGATPDVADELAQEAMLMVWRKAESFDPGKAAVSTWIFTIARNKRIDRLRRENRPEIDPEDLMSDIKEENPLEALAQSQNRDTLARSIKQLSDDQAEVIRMAFYEDKSHSVIAAELDLPLGTVKSRIRLALGRLREMVEARI